MGRKALILAVVIFTIFSCKKKGIDKEKILAKVGNTYITESYLNEKIIESGEFEYLRTKIGRKQFLDVLINEKLIKLAAESSGIANSKEYKDEVKRIEDELKKRLEEYKSVLLTRMWIEKIKKERINISEKDLEDYLSKYPYAVSFEQAISIDYETAQSIFKALKSGSSVDKIASKYAGSPDVVFNKIPPVLYGEVLEDLNDVVFKLGVGEVGGIIKTSLGYHVIKKISHTRIDTADPKIKERAKRILEKKKFDEYLLELENKYPVEVIDEDYK